MSVLKQKRAVSKAEFINVAYQIHVETLNFLTRLSARYSRMHLLPPYVSALPLPLQHLFHYIFYSATRCQAVVMHQPLCVAPVPQSCAADVAFYMFGHLLA